MGLFEGKSSTIGFADEDVASDITWMSFHSHCSTLTLAPNCAAALAPAWANTLYQLDVLLEDTMTSTFFTAIGSEGENNEKMFIAKVLKIVSIEMIRFGKQFFAILDAPSDVFGSNGLSKGVLLLMLLSLLYRLLVASFPYSGQGDGPRYGDFEAQRHWMELCVNLPLLQWYTYDLDYWGLDYPPLTAFHSFVIGKVAQISIPEMVQLGSSRGIEGETVKLFMRYSVILSDFMIFVPAAFLMAYGKRGWSTVLILLLCPSLVLIDHGHFQFNCVALGFVLFAVYFLHCNRFLLGSVCFCFSFCYKQMTLYFAPAFFFYLLKVALGKKSLVRKVGYVGVLGFVVLGTVGIVFLPLIDWKDVQTSGGNVISRVFPFQRGLFEDKVANFWCVSSVLVKWKQMLPNNSLTLLTLFTTFISLIPNGISTILGKTDHSHFFPLCLSCSALSFFMFSMQVHEKTILMPLLPILLLTEVYPSVSLLFSLMSAFSMFPLLERDGLSFMYCIGQAITCLIGTCIPAFSENRVDDGFKRVLPYSIMGALLVHVFHILVPTGSVERFPHLSHLLFVSFAFVHFVAVFLFLQMEQVRIAFRKDKVD